MQIPRMKGTEAPASTLIPHSAMYRSLPQPLPLDEAARWLVTVHGHSPSGIRSASTGDARATGGKSYPVTTWGIDRTLVYVEGATLADTLRLMTPPLEVGRPAWEWPATEIHADREPSGVADLLTWQGRRVRLIIDGDTARTVVYSNGLPIDGHLPDPMVAYVMKATAPTRRARRVEPTPEIARPLRVFSDRSEYGWWMLGQLLAGTTWPTRAHIAAHVAAGTIDPTQALMVRAVAPSTDKYRSTIRDIHEATVRVHAAAFTHPAAELAVIDYATTCDRMWSKLHHQLDAASGRVERGPDRDLALLADLEPAIQATLLDPTEVSRITRITQQAGADAIAQTGVDGFAGRHVPELGKPDPVLITTARAHAWFFRGMKIARAAYDKAVSVP